jgi:hypothetical protein
MKVFFLALLLTIQGFSQDSHPRKLSKIFYRSSQVALVLAHSLDIESSWGKHELNPLLQSADQTYGARGASIAIGIVALGLIGEELIVHKHPKLERYAAIANFAVAGVDGLAVRNNLKYPEVVIK